MIRLTDSNPEHVYLGGLHTHGNDGEFAYAWHDEFMQGNVPIRGVLMSGMVNLCKVMYQ